MGEQGKANGSINSMQRVKVYQLKNDGKWDDKGTGHVSVDYLERSEDLGLVVIDEEDHNTLISHRISSDEIYRKQEDTIISWRDPELSTEVALSFQEPTGCSYIWDHICGVQRNLHFNTLSNLEVGPRPTMETFDSVGRSHSNDESFHAVNSELQELPSVELSTLPLILKDMEMFVVMPTNHLRKSVYYEVVGGGKKSRVYGIGSQASIFYPQLSSSFSTGSSFETL